MPSNFSRNFRNHISDTRHQKQETNISRKSLILYLLLVIFLFMFLFSISIWFSWETRQEISRIDKLGEKEDSLKDEISKLEIQVTNLQSPENVNKIVEQLNMVRLEKPPIILESELERMER